MRARAIVNKHPKANAAPIYVSVPIKFERGKITTALFTQAEVRRALHRAKRNPEDVSHPDVYKP